MQAIREATLVRAVGRLGYRRMVPSRMSAPATLDSCPVSMRLKRQARRFSCPWAALICNRICCRMEIRLLEDPMEIHRQHKNLQLHLHRTYATLVHPPRPPLPAYWQLRAQTCTATLRQPSVPFEIWMEITFSLTALIWILSTRIQLDKLTY